MSQNPAVHAGTRIGHVHLKVADLDRALGFYCGVLGFEIMQRMGSAAAFISAGIALDGASDHGVSEALYLRDPDQNGVELYWDRPKEQWPFGPDGKLAMITKRLDVEALLRQREA